MNLAHFCTREDARVWAHWNHPFDEHLISPGLVVCSFQGALLRVTAVGEGLASWVRPWAHWGTAGSDWWLDGHSILCLLIQQAAFFIHTSQWHKKTNTGDLSFHGIWMWWNWVLSLRVSHSLQLRGLSNKGGSASKVVKNQFLPGCWVEGLSFLPCWAVCRAAHDMGADFSEPVKEAKREKE